jgi:hypothetical protein
LENERQTIVFLNGRRPKQKFIKKGILTNGTGNLTTSTTKNIFAQFKEINLN